MGFINNSRHPKKFVYWRST